MRTHPRASLRISVKAFSRPREKSERGRFLSPAVKEIKGGADEEASDDDGACAGDGDGD